MVSLALMFLKISIRYPCPLIYSYLTCKLLQSSIVSCIHLWTVCVWLAVLTCGTECNPQYISPAEENLSFQAWVMSPTWGLQYSEILCFRIGWHYTYLRWLYLEQRDCMFSSLLQHASQKKPSDKEVSLGKNIISSSLCQQLIKWHYWGVDIHPTAPGPL